MTEVWDQAAIDGAPGIKPVKRTHDFFGNVLTQTDRWGFTSEYIYYGQAEPPPAPWLRSLLKTVPHPVRLTPEARRETKVARNEPAWQSWPPSPVVLGAPRPEPEKPAPPPREPKLPPDFRKLLADNLISILK